MNEQKEMPVVTISPSPRFRYWFTPPESLAIKVSDIEPFVPKANWIVPAPEGLTVEIPAEKIFSKNVPRIPLRLLADLLPDHISSSDGMVKLPAAKLAAAYRIVQHQEELIPEIPPEPERLPEPEIPPVPEASDKPEEKTGDATKPWANSEAIEWATSPTPEGSSVALGGDPSIDNAASSGGSEPEGPMAEQPVRVPLTFPIIPPGPAAVVPSIADPVAAAPAIPCEPSVFAPPITAPALGPEQLISETQPAAAANSPAPAAIGLPNGLPVEPPTSAPEEKQPAPSKFPARRLGAFVGLPLFRRKAPFAVQQPIPAPLSVAAVDLPPPKLPQEQASQGLVLPEAPVPPPLPVEEPPVAVTEPLPQIEPEPAVQPPPAIPVRMLRTEHFPRETQNEEIVEQEPLQALFLTEETMTVSRVIELCGGLPGINSCVLAHGSIVVASHNVPDGVDLVSMSAHASDMLKAMRDSSARMGVGTVPAVTLHTEKGVISFFNREDLTMLVFHRDRGFIPGVREKMAAVLGELAKARLTLPVGSEEDV